jgi:glycine oxidase
MASGDVIVVGGGLIGLACAWRAAERGLTVTVVDDAPGSGASRVAAGMLAPVTEVSYGEEALLRLTIASARQWAGFAADLEAAAGETVNYRPDGTLLVGFDADDARALDDLSAFQRELGLDVERLGSRQCRRREPLLSPRVRAGLLAREDHQVEPRLVVAALLRACEAAGVTVHAGRVAALDHDGGAVRGVSLEDGTVLAASRVVLAAGSWSGRIDGLPAAAAPPVRPVKGQVLSLRSLDGAPVLDACVRGVVQGRSIYLVPRDEGRLVVGATQEERGYDTTVTAGATRQLLDDAARVVPGVDELELTEAIVGLRPGTPDNRPLIGPTPLEGLLLATGHHRNGVLLTPLTAQAIADHLVGDEPDPVVAVADPARPGLRAPASRTDAEVGAGRTV